MSTPIRVLILEDRPEDAELTLHELSRADFAVEWQRVETEKDFIAALDASFDLIIADYSLPQFDGLRALQLLNERGLDIPFILVSGTIGEELAVEAMKHGASDYLLKDRLARLSSAVAHVLEQKQLRDENRRADEQLRQTQSRLANILDNAAEAVVSINRENRIVVFNQTAERMFGYAAKEILGQPLDLLLPDGITGTHRQHVQDFTASPDQIKPMSDRSSFSARRKDGSLFPVEIGLSKMVEGSEELYTAMIVDITDRKRAERALVESERRFRETLENVKLIGVQLDLEGRVMFCNDFLLELTGYTRAEVIGCDWFAQFVPETYPEVKQKFLGSLSQGKITPYYENLIRTKRGEERLIRFSNSLFFDTANQLLGTTSIGEDITQRKRAEEMVRQSEARYRTLIEQASDGIFITNKAGQYTEVNPSGCAMLGYTREEILAMDYSHVLLPEDLAANPPKLDELIAGQTILRERIYQRKDGTVFPVEISAKMLSDGRIQNIVRDATERKRAEEEIRRRANEFEALYETARDLSLQLDLTTLLRTIAERAAHLLHATRGSIHFYHTEQQQLEFAISSDAAITVGNRLKLGEGLVGKVAESRKTMIVDHYSQWEHRSSNAGYIGMESAIGAPMIYNRNLIGVITVGELAPTDRKFTNAEAQLVSLFASHAASAVYNARLFDETQRRAEELSTLNEIDKAVSAQLQLESVLETIYQQVKRILPLDAFYIALYDANQKLISYPLFYDEGKRYDELTGPPNQSSRLFQTIKTGEPKLVTLAPQELESPSAPDTMLGNRSKPSASLMFVPLKSGTRIIGALSAQSYTVNAYTAENLTLLSGIANQVAIAIENARLYRETERSLARVQALHQIDRAISSSLDLTVTMNTFLTHATVQLGVDAADVLRLDQNTHMLEFVAGIGFRTKALQHTHLQLGDGLAGKAALERKMIAVSDLPGEINGLAQSPSIQSEGFAAYYAVPLIAKGRVNGVMEIFHRTPTDNDQSWLDFLNTLAEQAAIALDNAELYQNLQQANTDLGLAYDATILGWSNALDLRDHETQGHTLRVTEMALRLARAMEINEADLIHFRRGALLHDIGKMGVPDSILLKPGALTDPEWQVMRQHPDLAFRLLSPIEYLRPALDIPYCHHEKWDGTGYPRGLRGEQIPLVARIFAVVDVWDALGSDRSYRKAWDEEKTRAYLREEGGKHFDPRIVEVFLQMLETRV